MKIVEITENKKEYLDLLLLADEQEDMIDRYLDHGTMYVLDDNGVKCECVITDEGKGILEIKNIATAPEYQGKGYAKALIEFLVKEYGEQYSILQVGTGDSPLTIPFYESAVLSVPISCRIFLQTTMITQYSNVVFSLSIWYICKDRYKPNSNLSNLL